MYAGKYPIDTIPERVDILYTMRVHNIRRLTVINAPHRTMAAFRMRSLPIRDTIRGE